MKVGIIIHNPKGRTAYIAQKLKKNFVKNGHQVVVKEIIGVNQDEVNVDLVEFQEKPNIREFDSMVFGTPLINGEITPVMDAYLQQIDRTHNKISTGFLTQSTFGFNKGVKESRQRMIDLLVAKNIKVHSVEPIKWLNPFQKREVKNIK